MILLPAIDLYEKKGVRLYKGDYAQMTVYTEDPLKTAQEIEAAGAKWLHVVDLEGARDGTAPNLPVVKSIVEHTGLNVEVGGGIRTKEMIGTYLSIGVKRVILGSKATDETFLKEVTETYGEAIAAGMDLKDGKVAVQGWTAVIDLSAASFMEKLAEIGVKTVIVTDISRDGAMKGANHELYQSLKQYGINLIASGGVSSLADIRALKAAGMYGAILGKAMYTGAVDLKEALQEAA